MSIVSENSVTFSAYDTVEVVTDGYANFRALNSIDVVTSFPGGDIFVFGERMEIDAEHILVNVTAGAGAASTLTRSLAGQNARDISGSIKINNDAPFIGDQTYFSIAYWNFYELFNPPIIVNNVAREQTTKDVREKDAFLERVRASMPESERYYWYYGADFSSESLNIFKGAQELSVDSEQGDLRFEYAQDLLLASNQITGVSSGGIEIHAYGEGRRVAAEYNGFNAQPYLLPDDEAIIFGDLSSLNFRTDNAGSGEIRVQSEAGSVFCTTDASTTIRAGNDNLYFSSSGTLAVLNLRSFDAGYSNGEIDFDSAGDLTVRAFDDDINVYGFAITFGALANDAITFSTSDGLAGTMDLQVSQAVTATLAGDVTISSSAGDIYFTAACGSCFGTDTIFSADIVEINHADDAFFEYSSTLTVAADQVVLDALPNSPYGAYNAGDSGVVRFDGRKGDDSSDSDREVYRPTVFFSDELALQFDTTGAHDLNAGGFCEFDRAIGFEEATGLNGGYSVCICIDHTWQCRNDVVYDNYYWAVNPYPPDTYYPN
eukprot:TRINITY_DN5281_c0_g1_i1.p1 TRINITY_DN5281_c0_g1~~TRINITY_DN5281_c0_g1_i1.p1  ORF type:complete len:545 (-),score=131.97 TRINITY_DN5281_c0_g1_i1:90-1724(-)